MLYCKLKGGLGNMLFQVAGTLGIAKKYGLMASFPNLTEHLHYLNEDNFYNPNLKHALNYNLIFGKINQAELPNNQLEYIHYPFQYVEIALHNRDYLIEGFFQSEKYFINIRSELLELLKEPLCIQKIVDERYPKLDCRTTSIHVRRGDYLKNSNYHPIQPISYYQEAINILKNDTDYFLVFSDDIDWCRDNIVGNNIIYISDSIDYVDLYLMARCNNNIIANSSFSWWGAWLNKNDCKKVIAPTLWFGEIVGEDTRDIIPENWIKI